MSEKIREANRSARERLQQEREAHQSREKRKRVLIVSGVVAGVLAAAAGIGMIAAGIGKDKAADAAGPVLAPSGAQGKDELAIPVGAPDAPSTLTVWEDFRCPSCGLFESNYRSAIQGLEKAGQIKVEYHLATIIDGNMSGSGSRHAANAAACAQDVGKFAAYHDALYDNQPQETDDAFAKDSRLLELADKVPGLKSAPGFSQCVQSGLHNEWVAKSADKFKTGGFSGTPTILLNGESVLPQKGTENITPANLKKWVMEANKGKKPGTAPPETAPVS
ncbi:DsbA family protein [Streptomyces sp. NPDC088725]|uniref:DsbA family protein n=1 Tax=Streptomyces sp. NPDC088725 TaxID=3365873 RepID=UPI00381BEF5F